MVLSQLEKPERYYSTEAGRAWAKAVLKEYDYPVQTQILSPQGGSLAQLPAMANFSTKPGPTPGSSGPSPYRQALDKALAACRKRAEQVPKK